MNEYTITTPDGKEYTVTAPDEGTAMSLVGGGASPAAPQEGTYQKIEGAVGSGLAAAAATIPEIPVTLGRIATKAAEKITGANTGIDWNYWSPAAAADKLLRPEGGGVDNAVYETVKDVAPMVTGSAALGKYGGGLVDKGLQLAKDVGVTGTSIAGGTAGGMVGDMVGGDLGQEIGSLVGGGLGASGPGVAKNAGKNFLVNSLTDDGSLARLREVEWINRMARRSGVSEGEIPLSMGLVGSKTAGTAEDATAGTPFGGATSLNTRRAQYAGMDANAKNAAGMLRGGEATGEISKGTVGAAASSAAREAESNFRGQISTRQDALENAIGPVPVDVSGVRRTVRDFVNDPNVGSDLKGSPSMRMNALEADRNIPVDPALDQQLRHQQNVAITMIPQAVQMGQLPALIAHIQGLGKQIDNNIGVRYGALKDWRTVNGQQIEGMAPLSTQIADPMYSKATEAMKLAAIDAGQGAEFEAANAEAARLHQGPVDPNNPGMRLEAQAPIPVAERIGAQNEGTAYNSVFSPSNTQSASILDVLAEGAPEATRNMLADNLELKLRGQAAGQPTASPETFFPAKASQWLSDLPQDVLQRYAGAERANPADPNSGWVGAPHSNDLGRLLQALDTVMKADARRATRTLPGKGGNTLGAPQMFYGLSALLGGGLGGLTGGIPGAGIGAALTPSVLAGLTGKLMTNPDIVRATVLARRNPTPAMDGALPAFATGAIANQPIPVE